MLTLLACLYVIFYSITPTHFMTKSQHDGWITELNNRAITRIAISIERDSTHLLSVRLAPLTSGHRCRALRCRRTQFGESLIPSAITHVKNRPRLE